MYSRHSDEPHQEVFRLVDPAAAAEKRNEQCTTEGQTQKTLSQLA